MCPGRNRVIWSVKFCVGLGGNPPLPFRRSWEMKSFFKECLFWIVISAWVSNTAQRNSISFFLFFKKMLSIFSIMASVFHVKYVFKREFSTKKVLVDQTISQKGILRLHCCPLSELLYITAFGNPLFCIGVRHKCCPSFGCCFQGCRLLQKFGGGGNTKGQIKPNSRLSRHRFSQKTNELIWFVCVKSKKANKTNLSVRFFGRIYGAPICFRN